MTDKKKKPDKATSKEITRSSAVEYLTFVAAQGEGGVEVVYADEDIWLSQKMMAVLYDVNVRTVNEHLKKIFADNELQEGSVIRKFRITASDGKNYNTQHYNLSAIIAIGYKVNSERAVQFRKWATAVVKEFTIKGFAMDDERLKQGGTVLSKQYFEEQLQRIREIRLSERKFYQKITDIYATAIDYDVTATATRRFFATVQNKLHWAIHGQTAAEIIVNRADAEKRHMGLTTWKDAPLGDTHGFAVLDELRGRFPSVQSFLMDRATLLVHQQFWGAEPSPCKRSLSRLTEAEASLYRDLQENRFGHQIRLEQERISFRLLTDLVTSLAAGEG